MKSILITRCTAFLLACLMLMSSCGGGEGSTKPEESTADPSLTTDPPPAIDLPSEEALNIIVNGKSDYVIVYDETDIVSKTIATKIQTMIENNFGVILKLRSHSNSYDKEIIIGETSRDSSQTVYSALDADGDFAVMLSGDDLVIATNTRILVPQLYVKFEELFVPATEGDKNLTLVKTMNYHYRRDPAIADRDGVDLVKDGKSEYVIVYDPDATGMRALASSLSRSIRSQTNVHIASQADSQATKKDYEIVIGPSADRIETASVNTLLSKNDFAVFLVGNRLIITGTDETMIIQAALKFLENTTTEGIHFDSSDNYFLSENPDHTYEKEAFVTLYRDVYHSYGSYIEEMVDGFSLTEKADIALINDLINRMDRTAAFYVGSSVALYNGKKNKLDPAAYMKVAKLEGGEFLIPHAFAKTYFGDDVAADGNGYVNVSKLCESNEEYNFYFDKNSGLAIVSAKDVPTFDGNESDGKHTNSEYRQRMIEFFTSGDFPEPQNNAESTRKTVFSVPYEGPFYDWRKVAYDTLYSPSIITRTENGKQVIYVSHEISTMINRNEISNTTYVRRSEDDGATWEVVGSVNNMRWATLFEHRGKLYLLGSSNTNLNIALLAYFNEDGSSQTVEIGGAVGVGGGGANVLFAHGRIYRAYNSRIISIDENEDLTDPKNWRVSESKFNDILDLDWEKSVGASSYFYFEEINMVAAPDGTLYALARTNDFSLNATEAVNKAILLKVSQDGNSISFVDGTNALITMPTTMSRFICRYDEKTKQYVALNSVPNSVDLKTNRTVLAIVTSKDLINWQIKDYLVVERDMVNTKYSAYAHGYQYVDWVIDGDTLLFVSRDARDEVNMWHDGNYISYYRLENYADVIA